MLTEEHHTQERTIQDYLVLAALIGGAFGSLNVALLSAGSGSPWSGVPVWFGLPCFCAFGAFHVVGAVVLWRWWRAGRGGAKLAWLLGAWLVFLMVMQGAVFASEGAVRLLRYTGFFELWQVHK